MSEAHQDSGAPTPADPATAASEPGSSSGGGASGGGRGPVDGAEAAARVCEVALDEFEGPLDLLLHLVRRHELDILDIPIAFVCEKYLEYIEFMRALDLEVAGDYLVMAATLAYLKSRELVPQQAEEVEEGEDEDGPDPRQQLIARLLEYQKFKEAARRLDARPIAGRDTFARGQDVELPPVDAGLAPITLFRLADAYQRVLERARIHKSHEVVLETVSVAARMEQLATILISRSRFEFETLFLEREWSSEGELRSMLVVTLMSILELVRMGVASVHQPVDSKVILVERVASEEEAREALAGYDESISFGTGKASAEASGPSEAAEPETAGSGAEPEGAEAEAEPEGTEVEAEAASVEAEAEAAIVEAEAELEPAEPEPPSTEAVSPEPAANDAPEPSAEGLVEPVESVDPVAQVTDAPDSAEPAGAVARSVVSESPPHAGDEAAGQQADGEEHGENGEAEAGEGPQGHDPEPGG